MDHIQNLLLQTGWSCEDLILKLNEFKQKKELEVKKDVKTNGIDHKEESTHETSNETENVPESNGINEIEPKENEEERAETDTSVDLDLTENLTENENEKENENEVNENVFDLEKDLEIAIQKSVENDKDFVEIPKNNETSSRIISKELVDHTYTLNNKTDWEKKKESCESNRNGQKNLKGLKKVLKKIKRSKSKQFRTISKPRRFNYLKKSRKFRRQILKLKKIDRKLLIAQYKSPEAVRCQIMEQLQLLRSRRSQLSVTVNPSKDKIVNKKRYSGEKWSTVIDELCQLTEDQNVEIESNDILENQCDVTIGNDFETFDSNVNDTNVIFKKSNFNESITETLKNRIENSTNLYIEPIPGTSSSFFKSRIDGTDEIDEKGNKDEGDEKIDKNDISVNENEEKPSGLKSIMIVDVRGGCEIIPDDKVDENLSILDDGIVEYDNKNKNRVIKPTKTHDITKIKGWKNKRFSSSNHNLLNSSLSNNDNTINSNHSNKLNNLDTSNDLNTNTAFSSSNLDGFLEEADLHISFKIPMLESGVSTVKEIEKTKIPPPQTSPKEPDKDLLNLYHPRTLGQKKRIMTLKSDGRSKKSIQKPRTLAEKRRLMGHESLTKIVKEIRLNRGDAKHFNFSYVLFRGKKLKVVTKTRNDIIAYVKSIYKPLCYTFAPKKQKSLKTKPSIFNSYSPTSTVLHYRPGPLCKKANLQYNNENWKTTLKKLPKVHLTVIPQFKKPIHPYVEYLMPKYDFEITPDRLEFALTAVKPVKKELTCFEFNVPYQNNQQEILLREKTDSNIEMSSDISIKEPEKHQTDIDSVRNDKIDEICKDIVDKMLNYVEIKEISDDFIKTDVNAMFLVDDNDNNKIEKEKKTSGKKYSRKSNKTNNELRRLNVKVIEVNLEEKEEIKNCQKDYCRLGCVCRSLATTSSLVLNHCGRIDCMFECKCNFTQSSKGNVKVTLPTGVDLLSEGAVNRLENAAKRNLAKVEKEFTQTVIQSNNQTIVVGGCSNRQRRATKLPKKYTDYIEHIDYFVRTSIGNSEIYEDLELREYQLKNSQVSLTKIDLNEIIPYCLVHQTYDCQCKCLDEYIPSEESDIEMISDDDEFQPDETIYNKIMDISKKIQFPPISDSCARAKGIPTDYYLIRNRTKTFIKMRNRKFIRNMNKSWLKHDMDVDSDGISRMCGNVSDKSNKSLKENSPTDEIVTVTSEKSRRKQELVVRGDGDVTIIRAQNEHDLLNAKRLKLIKERKEFLMNHKYKQKRSLKRSGSNLNQDKFSKIKRFKDALQSSLESSRKFDKESKKIKDGLKSFNNNIKQVEKTSNQVKEDLRKVDEGLKQIKEHSKTMKRFKMIFPLIRESVHYFHPSPDITEQFINMLGKKNDTTFILLQWKTLAYYYQLRKVNVWFSSYYNSPKIIITDLFIRPKHFTNVKNFERSHNKFLLNNEIIRALITGNIPGTNPNEDVQVILELSEMLCYVHGTFKKNHNSGKDKKFTGQTKHLRKDKNVSLTYQHLNDDDVLNQSSTSINSNSISTISTTPAKTPSKTSSTTTSRTTLTTLSTTTLTTPSSTTLTTTSPSSSMLTSTVNPSITSLITSSTTLTLTSPINSPTISLSTSTLTSTTISTTTTSTTTSTTTATSTTPSRTGTTIISSSIYSLSVPSRLIPSTISRSTVSNRQLNRSLTSSQNEGILENSENNSSLFNYPTVRKIMFSKFNCQQYNYNSIDKDDENIVSCTIQARLPLIKHCYLWRMIKLNSDFSVLCLRSSDYRIKYSDLQKVLKMSDEKSMTIAIRTEQGSGVKRSHKDFGIYASPVPSNAVFIGPYLQAENHDVILMRYLNRELITTELFNNMKGLPRPNTGIWLQQKKDLNEKDLHTIDLTESDHEGNGKNNDHNEEDENKPILTEKDLEMYENDAVNFHFNYQNYIEIDVTKISFQQTSVVYFYTNVPNLGYVVGNQQGKDVVILRYPNFAKGLQFKTKNHAIEFLEKELSASFIEATGFKIKVTTSLSNTRSNILFDKILLKGYYVVNDKGFINVLDITPTKLKELNMTETKLCKGVKIRAAKTVYDRCLEVTKHCASTPFVHTRKSTVALLKWLTEEVEELKAESDRQTVQLKVFHQQKPMLVEHFKEIYLEMAPKTDLKFKMKMEELLKRNGISMDDTNSIETTADSQKSSKSEEIICIDIDRSSSPKTDLQETNLPIYAKNPDIVITATTSKGSLKSLKENNKSETHLPKLLIKDINSLKEKIENVDNSIDGNKKNDDKGNGDKEDDNKVNGNKKDGNKINANKKNDNKKSNNKKNDNKKSNNKKNDKKKDNKKNEKLSNVYKYLYKTTRGNLIEIAPEQYETLKANKLKSVPSTSLQCPDNVFQLGSLTITPKLSNKSGVEQLPSDSPSPESKNVAAPENVPSGFVLLKLKNVQAKSADTKTNDENT